MCQGAWKMSVCMQLGWVEQGKRYCVISTDGWIQKDFRLYLFWRAVEKGAWRGYLTCAFALRQDQLSWNHYWETMRKTICDGDAMTMPTCFTVHPLPNLRFPSFQSSPRHFVLAPQPGYSHRCSISLLCCRTLSSPCCLPGPAFTLHCGIWAL